MNVLMAKFIITLVVCYVVVLLLRSWIKLHNKTDQMASSVHTCAVNLCESVARMILCSVQRYMHNTQCTLYTAHEIQLSEE